MKNVLIVEDEITIAEYIKTVIEDYGYQVCGISNSGEDCIRKVIEKKPDIILMDVILDGEIDGIEAAKTILDRFYIPLIFCSSSFDENCLRRVKNIPYETIINKPFEEDELISTLKNANFSYTN